MENQTELQTTQPATAKELFSDEKIKSKFQELLGKKAQGFMTSVLQVVSQDNELRKADPNSIYMAAAMAATLDLPINNNLGFAYIIAYNVKQADGTYKKMAQFQIGYKGFIQLAQRSGVFKTISAAPIYEGQLVRQNPLTGFEFDFSTRASNVVIGYAAYFSLLNGFEKTLFMAIDDVKRHGMKYSKTFSNKYGLWNTDFEGMAVKTVIKLLLSKFAPLSIEMQKAIITDQAVIETEDGDVTYVDNETVAIDKEAERIILLIEDVKTIEELESLFESLPDTAMELYLAKKEFLTVKSKS